MRNQKKIVIKWLQGITKNNLHELLINLFKWNSILKCRSLNSVFLLFLHFYIFQHIHFGFWIFGFLDLCISAGFLLWFHAKKNVLKSKKKVYNKKVKKVKTFLSQWGLTNIMFLSLHYFQLDLKLKTEQGDTSTYILNGEWHLLGTIYQ